ncbi:MAG: hypothetical protein K6T83_24080 [Alicyclobacillus sp.]|nr:hypothetical protein [Alicyclobacillus sp.]
MTTFLDRILETKRHEVEALRSSYGNRRTHLRADPPRGFARAIERGNHLQVVAEVKKASPSKGLIASEFHPAAIAETYERAGAAERAARPSWPGSRAGAPRAAFPSGRRRCEPAEPVPDAGAVPADF